MRLKVLLSLSLVFIFVFSFATVFTGCSDEENVEESISQEDALQNHYDAFYFGEKKAIEKLAPDEAWEYIEETYDVKKSQVVDYYQELVEVTKDAVEENLGDNLQIEFDITGSDDLDDGEVEEIKDVLSECGISSKDVSKCVIVTWDELLKGSKNQDDENPETVMVQIGDSWYIYKNIQRLVHYAEIVSTGEGDPYEF